MKKILILHLSILLCSAAAVSQTDYNYLNGTLMRESSSPGTPAIYLIMHGKKCLVPNLETLDFLFYPTVKFDLIVRLIPNGEPLSDRATLVKGRFSD